MWQIDETTFVHGRGHHKSMQQRHYEKLMEYVKKLEEYVEKLHTCGEGRNSHSKTDHSATFMRIKTDYIGNDQLLPAYNVQNGVTDAGYGSCSNYIFVSIMEWKSLSLAVWRGKGSYTYF